MKIIEMRSGSADVKEGCVLTIGNFDGVHIGHQAILRAARERAKEKGVELVAMTFEPHPVAILHPEMAPGVLTRLELKEHLLCQFGVDSLIVLKDSRDLLSLSPAGFVDEVLIKSVGPSVVVEGEDFNFGFGRSGSVETLKELAAERGFEVFVVGSENIKLSTGQSVRVSSTMIRYMLESGHVGDAAVGLGRAYRLIEQVVAGRGRGRGLGYPTANMKKPAQVIPGEGVYAGFVQIGETEREVVGTGERIPAVFSIGQARTFGEEHPLLIEAHFLKENVGVLAGKWMAMDFVERIRGQYKFKTEKALVEQIAKDCEKAKAILGSICI